MENTRVEMHSFVIDIQSTINLNLFMTFTNEGPLHLVISSPYQFLGLKSILTSHFLHFIVISCGQ